MRTPLTVHPIYFDNNTVRGLSSWEKTRVARADTTSTTGTPRGKICYNYVESTPQDEVSLRLEMNERTDSQDQDTFREQTNPTWLWHGAANIEENSCIGFGVPMVPPSFDDEGNGDNWQAITDGRLVQRYNYDLIFSVSSLGVDHDDYDNIWFKFVAARGGTKDRKNTSDALYDEAVISSNPHRYYSVTNAWVHLPFNNYNHFQVPIEQVLAGASTSVTEFGLFMRAHGVLDVALSRDVGARGRSVTFCWIMGRQRNSTPQDDFARYARDFQWQWSITREPKPIVRRQPYFGD